MEHYWFVNISNSEEFLVEEVNRDAAIMYARDLAENAGADPSDLRCIGRLTDAQAKLMNGLTEYSREVS